MLREYSEVYRTKACERLLELGHCYPSGTCGLRVDNEAQEE